MEEGGTGAGSHDGVLDSLGLLSHHLEVHVDAHVVLARNFLEVALAQAVLLVRREARTQVLHAAVEALGHGKQLQVGLDLGRELVGELVALLLEEHVVHREELGVLAPVLALDLVGRGKDVGG